MRWLLLVLAGGGCATRAPDARVYPAAIHEIRLHPDRADAVCGALTDVGWRADCFTIAAVGLAKVDTGAARAACARLPPSPLADECAFQLAEALGDGEACGSAGQFRYDCALHLWRPYAQATWPSTARAGEVEDAAAVAMEARGLDPDDPQPWALLYAWLFVDDLPLDLSACTGAPSRALERLCHDAGVLVFTDRLSEARRAERFPCDGGPLPPELAHRPDRGLEGLLKNRTKGDLCDPSDDPRLAWRRYDEAPVRTPPGTSRGRWLAAEGRSELWPPSGPGPRRAGEEPRGPGEDPRGPGTTTTRR